MGTIKKLADNVSSADIVNAIIDNTNNETLKASPRAVRAEGKVTEAIAVEKLNAIGDFLNGDPIAANAFLNELFNMFVLTTYEGYVYQNKLNYLEKGEMPMGWGVRDIFVDIAKPYDYLITEEVPNADAEAIFRLYPPSIKTAYFHINYRKNYRMSTSDVDLKMAFATYDGVRRLIYKIVQRMYDAMAWDEELAGRYCLSRNLVNGNMGVITLPVLTPANATTITTTIKQTSLDLDSFSTENNAAGVLNQTPISEQLLLVSNKYDSAYTVEVQSAAFNLGKVEYLAMKRTIRSFSFNKDELARLDELFAKDETYEPFTEDELKQLEEVQCLLFDKKFTQFYRNYLSYRTVSDDAHLKYNHFLHIWKTYALSPFSNAIAFVSASSSVQSVEVSPTELTISKGQSGQLEATVDTIGFASRAVVWEIVEPTTNSTVSQTGVVKIGADETYTVLHVKATSAVDITKTSTATVNIPQPANLSIDEVPADNLGDLPNPPQQ